MRKRLFGGAGRKKFFEIETHGKGYTLREGKVGEEKKAKAEEKTCKTPQEAEAEAEKLLKKKIDSGYFPVEESDKHSGPKKAKIPGTADTGDDDAPAAEKEED